METFEISKEEIHASTPPPGMELSGWHVLGKHTLAELHFQPSERKLSRQKTQYT